MPVNRQGGYVYYDCPYCMEHLRAYTEHELTPVIYRHARIEHGGK